MLAVVGHGLELEHGQSVAKGWAWGEKAKPLNFFKFKGFGISQGLWRSAGFRVF